MSQHDHAHENPIDAQISAAVAKAVSHPSLIQTIISTTQENMGINLLKSAEAMRPVMIAEALVEPKPYNDKGDTLLLLRRRLRFVENASSLILKYAGDASTVTFDVTLYRDHPSDAMSSVFIEIEGEAEQELHRQLAEFYKPDMLGKSVQLTLLICPGLLVKKEEIANDVAEEAPAAPTIQSLKNF